MGAGMGMSGKNLALSLGVVGMLLSSGCASSEANRNTTAIDFERLARENETRDPRYRIVTDREGIPTIIWDANTEARTVVEAPTGEDPTMAFYNQLQGEALPHFTGLTWMRFTKEVSDGAEFGTRRWTRFLSAINPGY